MTVPIIILLGFPGAGKTTLARVFMKKHSEYELILVFDHYMKEKYIGKKGEVLARNYVIKAHDELYKDLLKRNKPAIIELGTNYPRYNCKKITKLIDSGQYNPIIVFCLLSKKLCEKRYKESFKKGYRHVMQKQLLVERMKRDFPKNYQIHCKNFKLPFFELNMEKPIEKNVKELEKILKL